MQRIHSVRYQIIVLLKQYQLTRDLEKPGLQAQVVTQTVTHCLLEVKESAIEKVIHKMNNCTLMKKCLVSSIAF